MNTMMIQATLAVLLVYVFGTSAMNSCSELVLDNFNNCITSVNQADNTSTVITKCDEGTYYCCDLGISAFGPDVTCDGYASSSTDAALYYMDYNAVQSPDCLARTDDLFFAYSDKPFIRNFVSRYTYGTDVEFAYRIQVGTESLSVAWGTETFEGNVCSFNVTMLLYPEHYDSSWFPWTVAEEDDVASALLRYKTTSIGSFNEREITL